MGRFCREALGNNAFLNNNDAGNGGQRWDHIVKRNVWLGMRGQAAGGWAGAYDFGGNGSGANSTGHYVLEANVMEAEVVKRTSTPPNTIYSGYANNIILNNYTDAAPNWYCSGSVCAVVARAMHVVRDVAQCVVKVRTAAFE